MEKLLLQAPWKRISAAYFEVQVYLLLVGLSPTAASIVYLLSIGLSSKITLAVLQSVL
uniref:Uncharacterized protein n=1 Tax=Arundo donax TaxID=35708 RepID=A0A0A8ZIQ1_ARUDO